MWAKVDDGMWKHRKFMLLSLEARGLWVTALSYCGMEQSPEIPSAFLTMACAAIDVDPSEVVPELVDAGLWDETDDGWEIHDWDDYQAESTSKQREHAGKVGGLTRALNAERERVAELENRLQQAESKQTQADAKQGASRLQAEGSEPPKHGPEPEPEPEGQTLGADAPDDDGLTHQEVVDRLAHACGISPPWPKSEMGRIAKAAKELREMGLESLDVIDAKARAYRRKWPDLDMTPQALTGNWSQLDASSQQASGGRRPPPVEAIA